MKMFRALLIAAIACLPVAAIAQVSGSVSTFGAVNPGDITAFKTKSQIQKVAGTPLNGQCLVYTGTYPTGSWGTGSCAAGGAGTVTNAVLNVGAGLTATDIGSGALCNTTTNFGCIIGIDVTNQITSFNGRFGAVVPALNDYSYAQISGFLPSGNQIGTSLYPAYGASIFTTATSTAGNPVIVVTSTAGLAVGYPIDITGAFGFPGNTIIASISGTNVTASANPTITHSTPSTIQFGSDRWSPTSKVIVNTIGAQNGYFGSASQGQIPGWIYAFDGPSPYPGISPLVASNDTGGWRAASFYARSSNAIAGGQPTIETFINMCIVDAHVTGPYPAGNSWCQYEQANLTDTTQGWHLNKESDLWSGWTTAVVDPYNINPLGHTAHVRYAAGDGQHSGAQNISAYIELINNGAAAQSGIVFAENAIAMSGGVGEAIGFASGHSLNWYSGIGSPITHFYGAMVGGFPEQHLDMGLNGTLRLDINGSPFLSFNSTVQYPNANNVFDLGASALRYAHVYAQNVDTNTMTLNGAASGSGVATANTPSTLVQRDASGNFSAGTITAAVTGHASLDVLAGTPTSYTPTLTWTGTAPTGASSTAQYYQVGPKLYYISLFVTNGTVNTTTGLKVSVPWTQENAIGCVLTAGNPGNGAYISARINAGTSDIVIVQAGNFPAGQFVSLAGTCISN